MTDRKNEIYRKKCYLNHGESKAVFGNSDTPIGRNDSTCGNVFLLRLNDSRHAPLHISFMRVHRQQACTSMRVYTRKYTHTHTCILPLSTPLTDTQTITHSVLEYFSSLGSTDLQHQWGFAAASLVSDLLWHYAFETKRKLFLQM